MEESEREGTFFIDLGRKRAVLNFRKTGNDVYAIHTYIPPEFRGRGIAANLVEALIEYCRKRGMKIYPACSYVSAYFEKRAELGDILSDSYPLKKRVS